MHFDAANSGKGRFVELRFEMNTLVLMHTCPHPLNPAQEYPRHPVLLNFSQAPAVTHDDFCRNSSPENVRGFANTDFHHRCGAAAGEGS